ncbi:MSCRAMM family protein, partial [Pseudolactococcus yaeyamensis]
MNKHKFKNQRRQRRVWLYIASLFMLVAGSLPMTAMAEIVNGTQIGIINGKPVVKAQSNDMSSASFQATVNGLLKDTNTDGVKYIADNISWQGNTSLYNGQNLDSFGSAARFFLGNDGFLPSDQAIHINKGDFFIVQNVGTIKDINTGQNIPVSLAVTNNGIAHGADGQTNEDAIFAIKNQGGTITIGAVTPASGNSSGSGQSENGGGSGGAVGDGSMVGFIEKVMTNVSLVRSDNGQAIPNDELLVAMKVSDVDANQLAEVGANGAIGYIVSPDTALSVSGNGLRSTSNGASVTDSALLMNNSYVVLKRFNSSGVIYTYQDGQGDHADIVFALFGKLWFELNLEGTFTLDKSLLDYGDTMPNNHYGFKPIIFDIFDSAGKDVGDITIPADGKPVESPKLKAGDYTVKERANSVTAATGQVANTKSYKVTVVAGKTGSAGPTVKVDNKAVMGKITISKTLVGYGKTLPNNLYSFAGIKYQVKSTDGKYTDTVILDKDGNATTKNLPLGDYDVQEIESSVTAATGQVYNPTVYHATLTWKDNATEIVTTTAATENKPVLGEISVTKTGVESGSDMWHAHYSLEGNEFKLTSLTDGKTYTAKTDKAGKFTVKNLPLGKYKVEETKASAGFVNTFKPVEVTLTWKDNKTEVVYGTATGTNQEVKGQNQLDKTDKETNATDSRGQGDMSKTKYQLFYGDDAVGSAPHKQDQAVKQNDIAKSPFTILKGKKVASYYADGKLVTIGDNLVLQVDAKELSVAVGNLTIGKYYWREVDAPIGYALDPNKHAFEIAKKDDQTTNIVTPNTKSQDQLIKAKINFQKLVEIPGESAESGYNDINFIFTPMKGTKADPKVVTTGIKDDMDGYGETLLEYGAWQMSEDPETAPEGYELIKDIYIHMTTDTKTDVVTITASYNEDGSKPFSKRQFYQSDNSGKANTSISGSKGGTITDSTPFISLSKLTFTDKGIREPEPSIDVEKTNAPITESGVGNNADKSNNLSAGDHDT